jgi:hypothetical protein
MRRRCLKASPTGLKHSTKCRDALTLQQHTHVYAYRGSRLTCHVTYITVSQNWSILPQGMHLSKQTQTRMLGQCRKVPG